jgi:hypothetical protein
MELINATWNDPQVEGGWSGPIYRVRATDIARVRPRILVDVSASTADEAWAKAMRACAECVEAEMAVIDNSIAHLMGTAARLRRQRRRIVAAVNSIETKGETP